MKKLNLLRGLPEPSSNKRIYLATPYSHEKPEIMAQRYGRVTMYLRQMMNHGLQVYSPITYGHFLASNWKILKGYDYWIEFGLSMLEKWATDVFVLMLPGWEISSGVNLEIEKAEALGLPVFGINPLLEFCEDAQ